MVRYDYLWIRCNLKDIKREIKTDLQIVSSLSSKILALLSFFIILTKTLELLNSNWTLKVGQRKIIIYFTCKINTCMCHFELQFTPFWIWKKNPDFQSISFQMLNRHGLFFYSFCLKISENYNPKPKFGSSLQYQLRWS